MTHPIPADIYTGLLKAGASVSHDQWCAAMTYAKAMQDAADEEHRAAVVTSLRTMADEMEAA